MLVSDLVKFLQGHPQDLPVVYRCYSEQVLLDPDDIKVVELCKIRPDGWVQNNRPDKPTQLYLLFPGN